MNIWCISKYASTPNYGAAARLFFLTKEFIAQGHSAYLFTSDSNHLAKFPTSSDRYNFEEVEGVPICWVKTKKYKKTASFARVLSWFDFELGLFMLKTKDMPPPDVVIVSSLSLFSVLYGFFLKKKFDAKLVFEVRDIWPLTLVEEGGVSRWHPLVLMMGWLEKLGYKKADLIAGTMPRLDLHVQKVLGYKKNVFCSPLGYVEDGYKDSDVKLDSFDIPNNKIIIGYAGSMGLTNSLEDFIVVIRSLKDNDDIFFALIGDGDLRVKFQNELSDCKNIHFYPKVDQRHIQGFLQRCDILYLSVKQSRVWDYGQSMNKVVEYMLAGKPILASYYGYPSMIDEAGCGIFVEHTGPNELQSTLLNMVSLGKENLQPMGKKGEVWIRSRRNYSTLAKEYLFELTKLAAPNNDPS